MKKILEIILVGTGFYVCGKDKKDYGTILPAIFSFAKLNQINLKPLFIENDIVFFDKKGSIIRFNENQKILMT